MITTQQTIDFLNEAFRNKRVRFSEDDIDDVRGALSTVVRRAMRTSDAWPCDLHSTFSKSFGHCLDVNDLTRTDEPAPRQRDEQ